MSHYQWETKTNLNFLIYMILLFIL